MIAEQPTSESTKAETITSIVSAIVGGASLKKIQGVPDSVMEGIYAHAYQFYQAGRLDDAEVFFQFLNVYDMRNPDYVMGLAATLQQKKQYQQAIESYEFAFSLAKNDYRPKLHIGQCHLFMKNKEQARESFSEILDSEASAPIKAQAQAYLGTLKSAGKSESSEGLHA